MSLKGGQNALSGVEWHEPIEGLEFGEFFLGSIASTYFARGRTSGYGFFFTDRRIIGFRMRRVSLALKAPFIALIVVLYVGVILELLSGTAFLFGLLLPLVIHFVNYPITWLTNRISERVLSRRIADSSKLLMRKRDFELRRIQVGEFLMKNPRSGLNLLQVGDRGGFLRIIPRDGLLTPIEIKVHKGRQQQKLRDLVISFSNREPKIRALEYS